MERRRYKLGIEDVKEEKTEEDRDVARRRDEEV